MQLQNSPAQTACTQLDEQLLLCNNRLLPLHVRHIHDEFMQLGKVEHLHAEPRNIMHTGVSDQLILGIIRERQRLRVLPVFPLYRKLHLVPPWPFLPSCTDDWSSHFHLGLAANTVTLDHCM